MLAISQQRTINIIRYHEEERAQMPILSNTNEFSCFYNLSIVWFIIPQKIKFLLKLRNLKIYTFYT